jgi:hypothetical protein
MTRAMAAAVLLVPMAMYVAGYVALFVHMPWLAPHVLHVHLWAIASAVAKGLTAS